jgi:pyruvate dehydrogenase complex dehydrogenase (E1) component
MIGSALSDRLLGVHDIEAICGEFIERESVAAKRVLAIIPDQTRSAPMDILFRTLY